MSAVADMLSTSSISSDSTISARHMPHNGWTSDKKNKLLKIINDSF